MNRVTEGLLRATKEIEYTSHLSPPIHVIKAFVVTQLNIYDIKLLKIATKSHGPVKRSAYEGYFLASATFRALTEFFMNIKSQSCDIMWIIGAICRSPWRYRCPDEQYHAMHREVRLPHVNN